MHPVALALHEAFQKSNTQTLMYHLRRIIDARVRAVPSCCVTFHDLDRIYTLGRRDSHTHTCNCGLIDRTCGIHLIDISVHHLVLIVSVCIINHLARGLAPGCFPGYHHASARAAVPCVARPDGYTRRNHRAAWRQSRGRLPERGRCQRDPRRSF